MRSNGEMKSQVHRKKPCRCKGERLAQQDGVLFELTTASRLEISSSDGRSRSTGCLGRGKHGRKAMGRKVDQRIQGDLLLSNIRATDDRPSEEPILLEGSLEATARRDSRC
jgi:hypothetical protein